MQLTDVRIQAILNLPIGKTVVDMGGVQHI